MDYYADIETELKEHGPGTKVFEQYQARIDEGDPTVHDLIWPGDRHPVDVLLRRTRALWADISENIADANLKRELGGELEAIGKRVAADATGDKALFTELCALRRRIAFANPLVDFDALVFTAFGSHCGVVQGWPVLAKGKHPLAGIYRVRDLKSDEPRIDDILETATVANGRLQGETLSNRNPRWNPVAEHQKDRFPFGSGALEFCSLDVSFDGTEIVFACKLNQGYNPRNPGSEIFQPGRDEIGMAILQNLYAARGHWGKERDGTPRSYGQPDPEPNPRPHGLYPRTFGSTYHLFRTRLDSGEVYQVTENPVYHDTMPIWMPDGRITFCSDRTHGRERCGGDKPAYTLCSVDRDGKDFRLASYHEINEWQPSVDNDGMLVYTRWDYLDRGFMTSHRFWRAYPDGRDPRAPHGNYGILPNAEGQKLPPFQNGIKAIPGTRNRYLATGGGHHSTVTGNLMLIDTAIPDQAPGNWRYFWHGTIGHGDRGGKWKRHELRYFSTPIPLAEKYVLVSEHSRIWLVDSFRNEILLYDASHMFGDRQVWGVDLHYAMPLRPRPVPPVVPSTLHTGVSEGKPHEATVMVMNVYDSDFDWPADIKIKFLRVIQVHPKSWPYSGHTWQPMTQWAMSEMVRQPLGTVPVEEDGSAHFVVPAGREIYFQALDARGLAVQTMRSSTHTFPGETLSCQGCHEDKWKTAKPVSGGTPQALRRPPSRITPEINQGEPVYYARTALPVFEAKCAGCHRQEKKGIDFAYRGKGGYISMDNLEKQDRDGWSKTTGDLEDFVARQADGCDGLPFRNPFVRTDPKWRLTNKARSIPLTFGALGSPLFKYLGPEHHKVQLTDEEFKRVCLWLDCNAMELGSDNKHFPIMEQQFRGELVWPEGLDPKDPIYGVYDLSAHVLREARELADTYIKSQANEEKTR